MKYLKKLVGICFFPIFISCVGTVRENPAEMFTGLFEKYMKKYWLYLISAAVFVLLSCNGNLEKINIEWVVLCDISDIDFKETPIELDFWATNGEKTFKLTPNKTKSIKIQKDMSFSGEGHLLAFQMYIFPIDYLPGFSLGGYKTLEIFLYYPWPIEETENSVTLLPNKQVLAYYYCLFKDNKIYRVLSKENRLNLDFNTMKEIDADGELSFEKLLDIIGSNEKDTFYYLETRTTKKLFPIYHYDYITAGYIVKSRIDNDIIVLDRTTW